MDTENLKDAFVSEAEDLLEKLGAGILKLEKNSKNKDLLDELMRFSHTMKSSAAAMGYKSMSNLTHTMEDVFDDTQKNAITLRPQTINALFGALDGLKKSVTAIKKSGNEFNLDQVTDKIKLAGTPLKIAEGRSADNENVSSVSLEEERVSYIKVPVERLDTLLDLTEELVIDKMRLKRLKDSNPQWGEVVDHFSRLVSDIQYQVMQVRLVPVEQVFTRFPRMIRDLAQVQKKKVDLEMLGGELEFDRIIIDKLGEPLVHLLRNTVEHGIEKQGIIRLTAVREKEYALITVEDDGKGIDFEKVKEVAVKRNIVGAREIGSFSKEELINLLFHPHLSTKEQVTETSGRGVGLSVVKSFADHVGGRIIVESPLPKGGTRFTLELPLTLAIINALLVGVKDSLFAIPFSSIERSVAVASGNIRSMADQDVAVVDGGDVPLVRIDKLFGFSSVIENSEKTIAVLVRRDADIAGIVVDKLVSEQEIIIKPLPSVLSGVKGFSGSTILGDGKTILILDVKGLLEDTKKLVRTN